MIQGFIHWVWHQVRPVARKEYIHMLNDPTTLRIAILLPIIQMTLFGYAINLDVENVDTIVYSEDTRPASTQLVSSLQNTTYMEINQTAYSKEDVMDAMRQGQAQVGIIIPPNYSDALVRGKEAQFQVLIDGTESSRASQILGVVTQLGSHLSQEQLKQAAFGSPQITPRITAVPHVLYNPDLETAYFTIPGLLAVVLLNVTLFLTLLSLVREREYGTMDQLLVTPLRPSGLVVGKMIPYTILALIVFNLALIAMVLLFRVPIEGNLFLLEACSLIFVVAILGLGLLISAKSSTQMQAAQVSQLIVLPSILLSGFVFSIKAMPPIMQFVSYCLPITYFIEILRGIILRGAGVMDLLQPIGMLSLIGTLIVFTSIVSFKRQMS